MRDYNHIHQCLCISCGSSYELFYDQKSDEYICSDCLDKEEQKEEEEND